MGVDGKRHTLESARGKNGLLVMFICNHCPYVKSVRDRIIRDVRELQQHGINSIAIMSNDPADYAEDSFDNMKLIAQQYSYPFPYVWDETQQVARDYGAVCTPDFFGFNANLELQYRGRLDASRKEAVPEAPRDLFNAMLAGGKKPGRGRANRSPAWVVRSSGKAKLENSHSRCGAGRLHGGGKSGRRGQRHHGGRFGWRQAAPAAGQTGLAHADR